MNIRFYIPEQTIGPVCEDVDMNTVRYVSGLEDSFNEQKASLVKGFTLMFDSEEEVMKYHNLAMNDAVKDFTWISQNQGVKNYTERETRMLHELRMKNDIIKEVLLFIDTFGSSNNAEHLQWVLDQTVRGLCEGKAITATDAITVKGFEASPLYHDWVYDHCYDENDEEQWTWSTGKNMFA